MPLVDSSIFCDIDTGRERLQAMPCQEVFPFAFLERSKLGLGLFLHFCGERETSGKATQSKPWRATNSSYCLRVISLAVSRSRG